MVDSVQADGERRRLLLPQRIFERLEDAIINRTYPPGTHLKEDEVGAELGVSRTPVREAFRMLQRAGWLEVHPHAGAYVRHPSVDQVVDVFELRQCLEEWGMGLTVNRISDADRSKLENIITEGMTAVRGKDVDAMARLNSVFHTTLAAATGNELLRKLLEDLEKQIRWHFSVVAEEIGEQSWQEHAQIVDAITAKDAARAQQLISEHILRTKEVFLRRLLRSDQEASPGEAPVAG